MATNIQDRGSGWRMFAGILFTLVGIFNFIDGIVAISNAHYLNSHLVFGDLKSWGWTMLILGIIIFLVGLGIIAGQAWAVFAGIVLAVFDAIGQLLFLPSYPVWSIIMIAVDVFVIYGLAMYGIVPSSARS
jgi:hypothetical protein